MAFDESVASDAARLAGGSSRALSFALFDAEWVARAAAKPVRVDDRNLRKFVAKQDEAALASPNFDSSTDWMVPDADFSKDDLTNLSGLLSPLALVEADRVDAQEDLTEPGEIPAHVVAAPEVLSGPTPHQLALVARVFAAMSDDEQQMVRALLGFDGEPVSHSAYGSRLGLPANTVTQRLKRLVARLRDEFKEAGYVH
jgi:DNA-directed RNA polymerase specialized sigma24 family protein